jgi:small-conductance mechanosensitive channel
MHRVAGVGACRPSKGACMSFPEIQIWDKTLLEWIITLGVAIVAWSVLRLAIHVVSNRLTRLAEKTATKWDDIAIAPLQRTSRLFLVVVAVVIAATIMRLPARVTSILNTILVVVLILQAGIWLNAAVTAWLRTFGDEKREKDAAALTTMAAAGFVLRLVVWSIVLLLVLDNLGVEIAPLIAGLGVGGIAVALAVQNILSDLFASLSIVLDKPFVIGDFVIVDSYLGVVEHVGLKTTRIRSLSGEQLVFSNDDILKSRLRNYGRMYERRVPFTVGVTYQTPREKLEKIPGIIREIVESLEKTRFDRSHVKEFGDFAIAIETVYYVLGPDYNLYMDIQQAINLAIHAAFEREGVEFAYPTQTLWVQQPDRP